AKSARGGLRLASYVISIVGLVDRIQERGEAEQRLLVVRNGSAYQVAGHTFGLSRRAAPRPPRARRQRAGSSHLGAARRVSACRPASERDDAAGIAEAPVGRGSEALSRIELRSSLPGPGAGA